MGSRSDLAAATAAVALILAAAVVAMGLVGKHMAFRSWPASPAPDRPATVGEGNTRPDPARSSPIAPKVERVPRR